MPLTSFADDTYRTGQQHGGGRVGEEARTGKRFPLELPIKIHKGETGGEGRGVACVIDSYEFVRNS